MNIIDLIVIILLSFYFFTGLRKGFIRTLVGPLALIIGTIVAIVYYLQTENFLWALLISILAPLALNLCLLITLKVLHKTFKRDSKMSLFSRFAGGTLAALWSGAWIILTLIFLVITPCEWSWFDKLQDNILDSNTYTVIRKVIGDKIPNASMNVQEISEMLQNPKKFKVLRGTDEYKELERDPVIRDLLSSKETMDQIKNQNIPKLLSNPKFKALLSDKNLIKKVFNLHKKLLEIEQQGEI